MLSTTGGEDWRSPFLVQFCPVSANVDDGVFSANIRNSVERGLPWLELQPANNKECAIVAGGPSLANYVGNIRGDTIVAVNNTARFLAERGINPDKHVILDARPSNARFVIDGPEYYIASQCAPETFDAAKNVTLWHPHVEGVKEIIGDRETPLIGGGTTVGLQAIALMYALGYRTFNLYGFDSSYRGDAGHAYAQPENDNDEVLEVSLNGRRFVCARWMAHQADEFKNVCMQLTELDCTLNVYGDGLLPYMAKLLMAPPELDAATYDMSEAPASWDFVVWLVNAEMAKRRRGKSAPLRVGILPGPKDGFRDDGLPVDKNGRRQLLENVMQPAIEMIGAVEDIEATNGCRNQYLLNEICDAARKGEEVPRFEAPAKAKESVKRWLSARGLSPGGYVTVTLREADHWPERNSNLDAWLKFATECKDWVVFVRDTAKAHDILPGLQFADAAEDIHIRAALYEKAKCNFFVGNGPAMLGFFGRAPFLMFKPLCEGYVAGTPEWWANQCGVPVNTQLPWADDRQRIVWADDTLDNIRAAWAAFPQTEKVNG